MKFITYDAHKCEQCYKCLRTCPTKAIAFKKDERRIIDSLCVKCGRCLSACQAGAICIQNDRFKIRKAILTGIKVAVSLAPSYAGAFSLTTPDPMIQALKRLGFSYVEETALAAETVSESYEKYIHTHEPENMITSCCPSANFFLEQRYPELIPMMVPIVSPMIAHGRDLKKRLGQGWEVAFIGPCLAKKNEAADIGDAIDYVLTFNELHQWFEDLDIALEAHVDTEPKVRPTLRGAAYPMGGSLFDKDFTSHMNPKYRYIRAEGMESLIDVFESLHTRKITGYCVEVNMCDGSCLNGPDYPKNGSRFYERKSYLLDHLEPIKAGHSDLCYDPNLSSTEMYRTFSKKYNPFTEPSPEVLEAIFNSMSKYGPEDHLNCGACGYQSCHDKAVAISRGHADITMCIPYMKSIAEGMQTAIFKNSPNPMTILDNTYHIQAFNPAFIATYESAYKLNNVNLKGLPIYGFIPKTYFLDLMASGSSTSTLRFYEPILEKTFILNMVSIEAQKSIVCILTDITHSEKQKKALEDLKTETLSSCQHLIDQQMRMVQEIAGMLGETTAEAKVNLNRLMTLVKKGDQLAHEDT